ncbi:hypothetical protein B296_00039770, partial [Ensete ventricosum]
GEEETMAKRAGKVLEAEEPKGIYPEGANKDLEGGEEPGVREAAGDYRGGGNWRSEWELE